MGDSSIANLKSVLRKRVSDFLAAEGGHGRPLNQALQEIAERGRGAYLFGGMLRDLMIQGVSKDPRDLDIVVAELTPELESYLKPHLKKRTRFGGLEVSVGHWDLDIWELASTWAFREQLTSSRNFEDLPKTTFLDLQAIVLELSHDSGRPGRIVESGFFEAIRQRTLDVNFEANPFPDHCVLSALTTAYRLDFALAPRLTRYVLHHGEKMDLRELCDHQVHKHGRASYGCDLLRSWITHLATHQREAPSVAARLPRPRVSREDLPWTGRTQGNAIGSDDEAPHDPTETVEPAKATQRKLPF